MGRPREPIKLIEAKGKKHLTEKEKEEREATEIKVPFTKKIKPPNYLNQKQKKEFKEIARKLVTIGIFTELDIDVLGRYIQSKELYLEYTDILNRRLDSISINIDDSDYLEETNKLQRMQNTAFKQCQSSARDLGLTVTSRCKIVIPKTEDETDDDKL